MVAKNRVIIIKREMRQDRRAQPKAPINENITAREVRLIGVDGEQIGIVSIDEALRVAEEAKLDLVEISLMRIPGLPDHGLRQSISSKRRSIAAAAKKNQHQQQIKEIKFRPVDGRRGLPCKATQPRTFLKMGTRPRFHCDSAAVRWLTRAGMELLKRVEADLIEIGTVEQHPKLEATPADDGHRSQEA